MKLFLSLLRMFMLKVFFNNLINCLKLGNSLSSLLDLWSSLSGLSFWLMILSSNVIEFNVILIFCLIVDEFLSCDYKLKLYFEVLLFWWGSSEKFCCLLKVRFCVLFFVSFRMKFFWKIFKVFIIVYFVVWEECCILFCCWFVICFCIFL